MAKKIGAIVGLLLLIMITACGKTEEDVVEKIIENQKDVESYRTTWEANTVAAIPAMNEKDEARVKSDLRVVESANEYSGILESGDVSAEYYIKDGVGYENVENSFWETSDIGEIDMKNELSTSYYQIVKMFKKIESEMEMKKEDDYYVFTFDGTSESIFDAQKEPYNLTVDGVDETEINQKLEIKVNKKTFEIENIETKITGEGDGTEIEITYTHTFSDFNEIDEITVPDEAMEEAA